MPGLSHLQYEEEVVHCEEKVYSMRRAASAVGKQDVWCEKNLCIIRNAAIKLLGEKVCSTMRVASAVRGEGCAV